MPCAHRALRLFRAINHRSEQRSRRWGALRSEIKEEAVGRGTFAEQGTPSAGAPPEQRRQKTKALQAKAAAAPESARTHATRAAHRGRRNASRQSAAQLVARSPSTRSSPKTRAAPTC